MAPSPCTQAYESTTCVYNCPSDPYGPTSGVSHRLPMPNIQRTSTFNTNTKVNLSSVSAQNVAGGYASGWCGVHVIHYQLNQGPGLDTFLQQIATYIDHSGRAVDSDPLWLGYLGQGNWQTEDQQHHCNFGNYDRGGRSGNCGFTYS